MMVTAQWATTTTSMATALIDGNGALGYNNNNDNGATEDNINNDCDGSMDNDVRRNGGLHP